MKNSVIVIRGGVSYAETNYGTLHDAVEVAKRKSRLYPEAKVYCISSDRPMQIVSGFRAQAGRLVDLFTRYRGKHVTADDTISDELWDRFNAKR